MAHKKGAGSTDNGRDSRSQRLGIKLFGGQTAVAGNIIVRQRGTKHHAGMNVGMGVDHTLYALTDGIVEYRKKRGARSFVSVLPEGTTTTMPVAHTKGSANAAAAAAPAKTAKKAAPKAGKGDDLTKVEGIGPKIAELFNAAGINSYAELAATSVERLSEILAEGGSRFASHDPGTWPKQAELAAAGQWDELKTWQDSLKGGK